MAGYKGLGVFKKAVVSSGADFGSITEDILPDPTDVINVGSTDKRFNKIFIKEINYPDGATVIFNNGEMQLEYIDDIMNTTVQNL